MIRRLGIAPLVGSFEEDYSILKAAEDAGIDSAWTNDGNMNAYVRMAAYACHTSKIILGSGAAIQPLRNPAVHAGAARDLAELSGGRVIVGLGSGVKPQLNRFYGIFGDQAEHPAPRMREFFQLMHQMLAPGGQQVVVDGKFFHLNAGRSKAPTHKVPFYLAAVNRHMLKVTGELADGLIGHPITSMDYLKNVVIPTISAGLEASGRKREDFDFASYVLASVNEDRALARRDVAITLGFYLSPRAFDCIFDESGWEEEKVSVRAAFKTGNLENLASAVTDRMLDACCLYGTADEVKAGMKRYDGLLDHLILYSPGHMVPRERQVANFMRIIDVCRR